jgi:hypothetical protein
MNAENPKDREFIHELLNRNFNTWMILVRKLKVDFGPYCPHCGDLIRNKTILRDFSDTLVFCIDNGKGVCCAYDWIAARPELVLEWITNEKK